MAAIPAHETDRRLSKRQTTPVPKSQPNASIRALPDFGTPITILSPYARDRNRNLTRLLMDADDAFYCAVQETDKNDFGRFISRLRAMLQDDVPDIWQSSEARQPNTPDDPAKSGAAFGRALARTKVRLVILDQIDYLHEKSEPLVSFVQGMASVLPEDSRVVLSGRALNLGIWHSLITQGLAQMEGCADIETFPKLEVSAFGVGTVWSNGQPITVWDGPLPRNLFFYFMDHPMLTRREIFETFWAEMGQREATNVFHVTRRKVAERVGHEVMLYSSGFYHQTEAVPVRYDVAEFEANIAQARNTPDALDFWENAVRLYHAPYLHTLHTPWVQERRVQLTAQYAEALIALGTHYKQNWPEKALGYFLRAEREAPTREDIYRHTMELYAQAGQQHAIVEQYELLQARLQNTFGIAPGRATRELYTRLGRQ